MFLNTQKNKSKEAKDENKGSTPCDTFSPAYPHQPNPHILPPEGMVGLSPFSEPAAGDPWQAPGVAFRMATMTARTQAQPQVWVLPCSLLALPGRRMVLLTLHTHIHIPKPRKLSVPVLGDLAGPATLLDLSRRSPPETNLSPQMSSDCCPGEPALQA